MEHKNNHEEKHHYLRLLLMVVLSFIAMFTLMYAMVDSMPNVIINANQFYMTALMTAPMVIVELIVMWGMYPNKKTNLGIISVATVALVIFFICIREQSGVGDKQFLRSLIPHHGAAILMVEKTPITDPEIKKLADEIIETQQREIRQMKAKLNELEK